MNSSFSFGTSNNDTIIPIDMRQLICFITNLILIPIVSLPMNTYVVWLIFSGSATRVASDFFALNTSIFEIIICFSAVPSVLYFLNYTKNMASPLAYSISLLFTLLCIGRPLFQCCISVERYVAVVHPVTFLKYKSLTHRVAFSALIWLIVLGSCLYSQVTTLRVLYYSIMLPLYLLLFLIQVFCSVAVLRALKQPKPGEKWSVKDTEANHMKKKAFWVILIILASMVLTYTPMVIFIFLYDSLSASQIWDGSIMQYYLMMVAGFVQPVLYLHRFGKLPLTQCC